MADDSEESLLRELAGWYCIAEDLRFALSAVRSLEVQQNLHNKDPMLGQTLWLAAQIAYSRCFVTGPTVKLDLAMFDGLPNGRAQAHRFLLYTATKHVTQPINPNLRVKVVLRRNAAGRAEGISYVPVKEAEEAKDFANLAWLATEALKHVERVETGLFARLKSTLAQGVPIPGSAL